jgi:WD40 repeat protein
VGTNPITCLCYSKRRLLCCGFADGKVNIYDEKTLLDYKTHNSKEARFVGQAPVARTFQAHPGPVTSLNMSGDMLVTCGENKKSRRRTLDTVCIEGLQNRNKQLGGCGSYHSDNLCKVYDVRTMRAGMPLQYTYNSAPAHAVFMHNASSTNNNPMNPMNPMNPKRTPTLLVAIANHGQGSSLMVHDIRTDFSMAEVTPLAGQHIPAECRCVASSRSAHMIAVGDDAGGLHVWTNSDVTQGGTVPPRVCLYEEGTRLELPTSQPSPLVLL